MVKDILAFAAITYFIIALNIWAPALSVALAR